MGSKGTGTPDGANDFLLFLSLASTGTFDAGHSTTILKSVRREMQYSCGPVASWTNHFHLRSRHGCWAGPGNNQLSVEVPGFAVRFEHMLQHQPPLSCSTN